MGKFSRHQGLVETPAFLVSPSVGFPSYFQARMGDTDPQHGGSMWKFAHSKIGGCNTIYIYIIIIIITIIIIYIYINYLT